MRLAKLASGFAIFSLLAGSPVWANIIITPTFDASITGNGLSVSIQASINNAIGVYQSLYADPITVTILYRYATTGPDGSPLPVGRIAQSNYTVYSQASSVYTTALAADTNKSANDITALASLPGSPLATKVDVSSANGRAVGEATPAAMNSVGAVGSGAGFIYDGIVTLNSGISGGIDFDRSNGITAGSFDAIRSIEHEMDEVLGLGSILPATTDFTTCPPTGAPCPAYRPQDLFRWSAPGVRSLSTGAPSSYFSINGGVTSIVGFNQTGGGDYGDWLSPAGCPQAPALVQYAFSCPDATADILATSPEGINLDVIGYGFAVPEPTSLILMLSGIGLLAAAARRRASATAAPR